jgi:hypothetical protein
MTGRSFGFGLDIGMLGCCTGIFYYPDLLTAGLFMPITGWDCFNGCPNGLGSGIFATSGLGR